MWPKQPIQRKMLTMSRRGAATTKQRRPAVTIINTITRVAVVRIEREEAVAMESKMFGDDPTTIEISDEQATMKIEAACVESAHLATEPIGADHPLVAWSEIMSVVEVLVALVVAEEAVEAADSEVKIKLTLLIRGVVAETIPTTNKKIITIILLLKTRQGKIVK